MVFGDSDSEIRGAVRFAPGDSKLGQSSTRLIVDEQHSTLKVDPRHRIIPLQRSEIAEAREEAKKIVAETREASEKRGQELVAEFEKKAEKIVEEARERAIEEREKLFREAKGEIADLVIATTEKVLREKLDTDDAKKSVSRFLA